MPGKTHEDSIRELAAKTPYMTGQIHDTIVQIKAGLLPVLTMLDEPDKYGSIDKLKVLNNARNTLPLIKTIPRPTKENCNYPNSIILIEIRDWLIPHIEGLGIRCGALKIIFDGIIIIYEYDPPYRFLIDKCIEKIKNLIDAGLWLPAGAWLEGKPVHYTWWKE
jgi:hypothetical protein